MSRVQAVSFPRSQVGLGAGHRPGDARGGRQRGRPGGDVGPGLGGATARRRRRFNGLRCAVDEKDPVFGCFLNDLFKGFLEYCFRWRGQES